MKKLFRITFFSVLPATLYLTGLFFPPLFILKWISFLPLFRFIADGRTTLRQTILCAGLTGAITCAIAMNWLAMYSIQTYFLACLILSPTLAMFLVPIKFAVQRTSNISLRIMLTVMYTIIFLKLFELTPVSAAGLEHWFYGPLPFLQTASFGGLPVLAGIITGLDMSLVHFHGPRPSHANGSSARKTGPSQNTAQIWAGSLLILLMLIFARGTARMNDKEKPIGLNIALIQHNLPISGAWRLDHPEIIRNAYERLAIHASSKKPDLIIFPLYTFPEDILRTPGFFTRLARVTGSYILVASHVAADEQDTAGGKFFSAAALYSPSGKTEAVYRAAQKPPLRNLPEQTASHYEVLDTPLGRLGIMICYEDTNPRIAKKAKRQGAALLISISNPGHFQKTILPQYHLLQTQLRAIESGMPTLRISSNGYTAYINSRGKIIRKTALGKEEILHV